MKPYLCSFLAGALLATGGSAATLSIAGDDSLQFFRPNNREGVNIFETFWLEDPGFDGLAVNIGGHFTQQAQAIDHENENPLNLPGNELKDIGAGFNLATANLTLDAQLEDGIRMNLVTYLSSRHHPETWVKAGYVQIDKLHFLNSPMIDSIMENVSLRVGHMEINYGDQHFRRTDNANAMYNPFVGNLIMDAFATEIGGEVYYHAKPWFAMVGVTDGEIRGGVDNPGRRSPALLGKLGYDNQINDMLRVRLTGSIYHTESSNSNTLYSGDRAGSRYYWVMENTTASVDGNFTSGRFNPGFRDELTAFVINPFIKYGGLEIFGNFESATGGAHNESSNRRWNQYAGEVLYRFLENESVYVGARYNLVEGDLPGSGADASIDRIQIAAGWYVTKYMLVKAEYVVQNYDDFPPTDIRHQGKFDGFMVEASIGF